MPRDTKKHPMRHLGEFVGELIRGLRSNPGDPDRRVLKREIEEDDRGDVVLRRTTIEEVEFRGRSARERGDAAERPDAAR